MEFIYRKMKYPFRLISLLLLCVGVLSAFPQSRNIYYRADVESGNVYTFVGSNLITAFANYFSHNILFDNSFQYSFLSGETNSGKIKTKPQNLLGLTARDLFNDITLGGKIGYKSDSMDSFNFGVYGSFHYKLNQFKCLWQPYEEYVEERFSFIKPGVGVYGLFGGIEHKYKFQVEAGVQYCIPSGYHGAFGNETKNLNGGISTHYALKVGGSVDFSGGIFLDIYHFDIYKKEFANKFKMFNLGLTLTITPKRSERFYQ
ncbi:MAG: hypothetical protein K2M69_06400 [Muribaculaceae bacterium]|nr:hypothetical protein [Muribaculaceae bacterium]